MGKEKQNHILKKDESSAEETLHIDQNLLMQDLTGWTFDWSQEKVKNLVQIVTWAQDCSSTKRLFTFSFWFF